MTSFWRRARINAGKNPQNEIFKTYIFSSTRKCELNSHWNPFYFNCDYCKVKYTAIGKLENWAEDLKYINKLGNLKLPKKTYKTVQHQRKSCKFCTLDSYFQNISSDKIFQSHIMTKKKIMRRQMGPFMVKKSGH